MHVSAVGVLRSQSPHEAIKTVVRSMRPNAKQLEKLVMKRKSALQNKHNRHGRLHGLHGNGRLLYRPRDKTRYTIHYTLLLYITLNYTTLHYYSTLYYTELHYTTLHYTTPLQIEVLERQITADAASASRKAAATEAAWSREVAVSAERQEKVRYTLHSTTLHNTAINYTTLHLYRACVPERRL